MLKRKSIFNFIRKNSIKTTCKLLSVLLLACLTLWGCRKEEDLIVTDSNSSYVYCLNINEDGIVPIEYDIKSDGDNAVVAELLEELKTNQDSVDYLAAIPEDVEINSFSLEDGVLNIDFNISYSEMKRTREILCRACIVNTLSQIESIDNINFTVIGDPLTDNFGEVIGNMNSDDFLSTNPADLSSYNSSEITLYFANEDGTKLKAESRSIRYNTIMPLEKQVIENLMDGPFESGNYPTIPEGTNLLGISINEGICYINFSEEFITADPLASGEITISSIVNSITQSTGATQVMISVEGSSDATFQGVPLGKSFMFDMNNLER